MAKTYQTTIKNARLALPPEVRKRFSDILYITKGTFLKERNNFISLYTEKEWEDFQEDMQKLNLCGQNQREIKRFFFQDAYQAGFIYKNMIVIPPRLLKYLNIETEDKNLKIPVSITCDPDAEKGCLKCIVWKEE